MPFSIEGRSDKNTPVWNQVNQQLLELKVFYFLTMHMQKVVYTQERFLICTLLTSHHMQVQIMETGKYFLCAD